MAGQRTVYLAGPDVFLPDAAAIGRHKKELCAEYGFKGLFPFDNEIKRTGRGGRIDSRIYRANVKMIRDADFGIFNLTPFRGSSADVGTVFELGMFAGLGKPVFGYTSTADDLLSRVRQSRRVTLASDGHWRDRLGMSVENFDNADNLMIDGIFLEQGRPIVRHKAAPRARFTDMTGFEMCLQAAAREFASGAAPRPKRAAGQKR